MGRNKTGRKIGAHTEDQMQKALDAIKAGKSIRQAAMEHGIAITTLQRYNKKDNPDRLTPNYSVRKIFTAEQEEILRDYYKKCAILFYGLTTRDYRQIAYDMAKMNNIPIPESWEANKMAGKDWQRSFRERFPDMTLCNPKSCNLVRSPYNLTEAVKVFFDNLQNVLSSSPAFVDGTRIYNLDEMAISTEQKNPRVLASKGKRNVCSENGTLVTTCNIISAGGVALPPALVFPCKNINPQMKVGTPPRSLILANPTGWNTETFVEMMKHFVQESGSTKDSPTVLIMDNHESHVSIEALNLAKESGVSVVTLHQNTSLKLQPLAVGINEPFKSYYSSAMESWIMRNPGCSVTIHDIGALVVQAFEKCMTADNIKQSFLKTGIYPFERVNVSDEDFTLNNVTDTLAAEEPEAANSKRKKTVETEIKEENIDIDFNTDLILAEEFEADIDETTNESTDPIKTEEFQEFEMTHCLENSQNYTNRKRILHKDSETDDTEQKNKTEKRNTEDPDLSFFYSLMPDMKEMSNDQKRRFKIGVLQLASTILQEK